jgi:hypothetical protein
MGTFDYMTSRLQADQHCERLDAARSVREDRGA